MRWFGLLFLLLPLLVACGGETSTPPTGPQNVPSTEIPVPPQAPAYPYPYPVPQSSIPSQLPVRTANSSLGIIASPISSAAGQRIPAGRLAGQAGRASVLAISTGVV